MFIETPENQEKASTASIIKPIQLGISQPEIDKLAEQYKKLTIAGPEDRTGHKVVYDARQIVKRTRIAVDKKRKELKADAIAYTKQVDQVAGVLIGDLAQIEDHLEREEKAYNDERDRIAHEKAMAQQQRTEGRVKQLKAYNFEWNAISEAYEFDDASIPFEDIKGLTDEEWAPVCYSAEYAHRLEQDRLADIQRAKEDEAARVAAEQQAIADEQEAERVRLQALADENRRVAAEQAEAMAKFQAEQAAFEQKQREAEKAEADRLQAIQDERWKMRLECITEAGGKFIDNGNSVGFDECWSPVTNLKVCDNGTFASFISNLNQAVADAQAIEAAQAKQDAIDEAARKKADKERAKRLAPDKNKLSKFFVVTGNTPAAQVTEQEAIDLQIEFIGRLQELVNEFQARLTDL